MLLVFGVSLLVLFEVFFKPGCSSWITKSKSWMWLKCLLILTPYINMEPLYWLSRTFRKRDCAVGWDHLFDCFSSFINGFSFSCLPDSQKGNLLLQTRSVFLCPPTEKGQRIEQVFSQLFVYWEPLSPKSKHFEMHTYIKKKGFLYLFLKNHTFWWMCNLKAFSYVDLHLLQGVPRRINICCVGQKITTLKGFVHVLHVVVDSQQAMNKEYLRLTPTLRIQIRLNNFVMIDASLLNLKFLDWRNASC